MTQIINSKKKKEPFDYQKAEAFTLTPGGDGTFNNSYYFSGHDIDKEESFYVRLGLRDNGKCEVWVYYNKGEKSYYLKDMIYNQDNCPLTVSKNNEVWSFSFKGELTDDKDKLVSCELNCDFTSNNQVVDFFSHMPTSRICTSIAQDKWSKEYFEGFKKNHSTHYEQEGWIKGTIKLQKKVYEIDLPCVRDHSYGRRVWGYMNNHLWLAGVGKNCLYNFSMVSYPSMSILEEGHLRLNENPVEFVTKASYNRNEIVKGYIPEELTMFATINNKRKITIKAQLLRATPYVFENGDYTLIEGIANYTIDGIKCRGILEIGFNKDQSRFMNGKNIDEIRE